jgi:REP element-mobilizing transposase RayT
MRFDAVVLDREKMIFVESSVPEICVRGGWTLHTCAAGPDHVHTLLTTTSEGDAVRKWLKRWLGECLSARWKLPDGATWWAEGGSVRWVWTDEYFARVLGYVRDQRALR